MCECPRDWIICFRRDCERKKLWEDAARKAHEVAQNVMGDARVSVGDLQTKVII